MNMVLGIVMVLLSAVPMNILFPLAGPEDVKKSLRATSSQQAQ